MPSPEETARLIEQLMKERGIVSIEYGPGWGAKGNAWHVVIERKPDGHQAHLISDYSLAEALAKADKHDWCDWE